MTAIHGQRLHLAMREMQNRAAGVSKRRGLSYRRNDSPQYRHDRSRVCPRACSTFALRPRARAIFHLSPRNPRFKGRSTCSGSIGCILWRNAELVHLARFLRACIEPRIFEHAASKLMWRRLHRTNTIVRRSQLRNIVCARERDHLCTTGKLFAETFVPHGAITRSSGRERRANSKRTWSFPFPVAPCASASAFSFARSPHALGDEGTSVLVPRKYCPS